MNFKLIFRSSKFKLFVLYAVALDVAAYGLSWSLHRHLSGPPMSLIVSLQGVIFSLGGLSIFDISRSVLSSNLTATAKTLAEKAGVPPPEVWVFPTEDQIEDRGAYLENGTIFVSQAIVRACNIREQEFVVAHEIAHLKRNPPRDRWMSVILTTVLTSLLVSQALSRNAIYNLWFWICIASLMASGVALVKRKRRSQPLNDIELLCDRTAVELTGDPESAVSMLEKIIHPLKVRKAVDEYPSLEQRLANLQARV